MAQAVKRRYDDSRRLAQVKATRLRVIETAKRLFIEEGYPATTIEAVAAAADVTLPTLYRLFGSKRAGYSWSAPHRCFTSSPPPPKSTPK